MRTSSNSARNVGRGAVIILALAIAAAAFGVRVAPRWAHVIDGADVLVADPDACYHLRRAERIAIAFPDLAVFDRFVNFPAGAHVIWPPLYDTVLAGVLALFPAAEGASGPSVPVALLPPLLFAATVLALLRIARRMWPQRPFLWVLAAGVPALLPASFPYTEIAQLDHHAAELFAVVIFVDALGAAFARARVSEAGRASPFARAALWPAAALAAALATQLTLVALAALVALACATAPASDGSRALTLGTWICALAALFLAPLAWAYHAAGAPFAHFRFGLFQPALLVEVALLLGCLRALCASPRSRRDVFAAASLAIASLVLGAALAGETASGLAYVVRGFSRWQETIGESQSPFAAGALSGIVALAVSLSALVVLAPIAFARLFRAPARRDPGRRVLLIAAAGATLGALLQSRFLPHCALFVGLLAAVALEDRRRTAWIAAAVAVALAPTLAAYGRVEETELAFARSRPVLEFLAQQTPRVTDDTSGAQMPEYGVLAEWSYGHYIQYHGERPAFADNFGDHAADLAPVRALFLQTDASHATAALDSMRARYVLVRDLASNFEGLVPDRATWTRYAESLELGSRNSATLSFRPGIQSTLLYRLAWRNGAGFLDDRTGAWTPPVSSLRLVAESESLETIPGGPATPFVKLYERVSGARVRIEGRTPGEEAALLATVRSPRGRLFPYVERLIAGNDGAWEAVMPYASESAGERAAEVGHETSAVGVLVKCEIASRSGTAPVPFVSDAAVREGATIIVSAFADSARGAR
ncbi:MAG: hypothetical protein ACKVU1_11240 [bacterium]